jgi:two-component system, cell cycle response regulator
MPRDSRNPPSSLSPSTLVESLIPRAARTRGVLMVLGSVQTGRVLSLALGPSVTIGRSSKATHRLDEPSVSGIHVRIICSGSEYILADEQATNGTFVNGTRLVEPTRLRDGDRIQLGPGLVLRFTLVDEAEERSLKTVYESAHRDGLTGVFNRKHLEERLASELAYAERHGKNLSIILFDLDDFKQVNDLRGHLAGDQVLRVIGAVVMRESRAEDIVARYGGEEFVHVVRDISADSAVKIAERTRLAIAQSKVDFEGNSIRVTASAGVASRLCCGDRLDRDTLLGLADERLYEAKLAGRNRVVGPPG